MRRRLLPIGFGALLFGAAVWVLYRELRSYDVVDVLAHVRAIPSGDLVAALALAGVTYLVFVAYDVLSLAYVGHRLGALRTVLSSFIATAFSQNLGLPMLTGGSIRYRFWASRVPAGAIARAVTFSMVTFWIGILAVGGVALLSAPADAARIGIPPGARIPAGLLLVGSVSVYLGWNLSGRRPLTIAGWRLDVPGPRLAFLQLAVSVLDWAVAGGGAYLLLPEGAPSFPVFLGCFLLAQIVALVSHVPGGIGVFETMVVLLLAPWLPADAVLGALLVFRVLYYLLPFALAALLLAAYEIRSFGVGVVREGWTRVRGRDPL